MKFEQFAPTEPTPNQVLDEVRMGQSDLDRFINSSDAQGIKAGFEAELCFVGKGGADDDYESEPDYDYDESARDIDDICRFFHDGDYNGRREVANLRDQLNDAYWEWQGEKMGDAWYEVREEQVREYIKENDWDRDSEMENYLREQLDLDDEKVDAVMAGDESDKEAYAMYMEALDHANERLDEMVQESIDEQDRNYDYAREEWEYNNIDDFSENDWLDYAGLSSMSDIEENFDIQWPYWTEGSESESGFNEHSADELARSLRSDLGVEVKVGSGYHSVKRTPSRWIIEADSSLEADDGDMPAEIISPPMPIGECLDKIREFFVWAEGEDAYTNSSTGFHVGVSLPHVDGRVDYVKLALFLGDQHVLEKFGRESNYYCKSAFEKIKKGTSADNVESTFELMRKGLIEFAAKTLKQAAGHGKYTSINMKNDYVEFRSMGDEYHTKVDEIIDTVKRYAYAMFIASRPDLHRDEYAKKLYKMLAKSGDLDAVALFSKFSAGDLSKEQLVATLKDRNEERKSANQPAPDNAWQIVNRSSNTVAAEFISPSHEHAVQKFHDYIQRHNHNPLNYTLRRYGDATASAGSSTPPQYTGAFTGQWRILDNTGRELYRFGGIGNSQSDANRVAHEWLMAQDLPSSVGPVDVVPVMS